ncbi:hypothetical protein CYMTET_29342 [Cymbomonas tetramitiformis]|uniref:Uncharacterized protein n=1 Tax=Cymbomonas tetramitiformis TaxID=36881 RepID=A0AAE0KV13_9CHLO|nr:hypothetical protein CYMTET_29342 [Cymbomonas tetramitiformis]
MKKEHGQHQPDKAETHLPQGMTKLDVYEKFVDDLPEFEPLRFKVSESFWYRTWRMHFPDLKCPKICKFSECKICSKAKLHKQVAPAEMKVLIEALFQAHRDDARAEREKYYKHLRKSSKAKGNPNWWKYTTMIIDGMTQRTTQLPHFKRMSSWVKDNKALIDTHCMGILVEGVGRFLEFNFSHNYSDNSNYHANVIQRAVLRVQQH